MALKIFKNHLRAHIRKIRNSLSILEQQKQSIKIAKIADNFIFFNRAEHIAIFLPFDGEINTYPLIYNLLLHKRKIFVPVVHSFTRKELLFVEFKNSSLLQRNKYNIFEPILNNNNYISINQLDIIIVPLVAFDQTGLRLGMGGGFYDILLRNWTMKKKYFPIGLAYDFQFVLKIPKEKWDVSLPVVLTPKKIWTF
ncbi:5-formyltetrahydrofolate cyclo-ligase [Buchnera aphidicola (Hyadaphis tataricae)]|uniref:5-formyltetrahydrofolate cyclo-ligase n=1 Tax=Buchnera aphidicola (Hyadaphis tataricae) TaxID=1241859 RepID=A0A4D6Y701_9GAMM|nr:5-formyltetrahydrofolate cyclo-ligase [Buchnera aphidicola]QCI21700.1 5-formyltetrahydrofolate cyclo-ligase [Buchnera aphidicola (Hyadaphis tataricae)]